MIAHAKAVLKMIAGFALLIVGGILALPGVPGPGILVILFGLVLLSDHFVWAKKALAWGRKRAGRFRRQHGSGRAD